MFKRHAVQEIFPTPLWIGDLGDEACDALNRHLLKTIYELVEPREPVAPGGSWQTDPTLHERDAFSDFMLLVMKTAQGALEFLDIEYEDFVCTGCWANINPTGGKNSSHTHPNNYLSGVYYVAVPEGAGNIEFADPRTQAGVIMPRTRKWNKFTGNKISVPVMPGRMVIFPAWLSHSVPVNISTEERVSISFNIMLTRYTETMSGTLWTSGSAPLRD